MHQGHWTLPETCMPQELLAVDHCALTSFRRFVALSVLV
jgi:hypothetical protein